MHDVTINYSVDDARTNGYPVAGILLDPLESEVLETIYSLRDLSKRGRAFCSHAWTRLCYAFRAYTVRVRRNNKTPYETLNWELNIF